MESAEDLNKLGAIHVKYVMKLSDDEGNQDEETTGDEKENVHRRKSDRNIDSKPANKQTGKRSRNQETGTGPDRPKSKPKQPAGKVETKKCPECGFECAAIYHPRHEGSTNAL